MSRRTKLLIQNKQVVTQKQVVAELAKLKTPQPVGGDILAIQGIPDNGEFYLDNITLNAGETGYGVYSIQPFNDTLTLWEAHWTLYIDPTSFQSNTLPTEDFIWPDGSSFDSSSTSLNLSIEGRFDWATSFDETNRRVYKIGLRNGDSISHTYYFAVRFYLPNLNQ